jgi:hypothetical protein
MLSALIITFSGLALFPQVTAPEAAKTDFPDQEGAHS